jgi:hypothetical protein
MSEQGNARRAPHALYRDRALLLLRFSGDGVFVCFGQHHGRARVAISFNDEIATLSKIEPEAAREIIATFPATDDIHPPFSYLLFYGLRQFDFSDAAMRLCSLTMSFVALALCHVLVLRWLSWRVNPEKLAGPTRIVAVLIFGLMPLTISQGDALRWYPVYAVLIALFRAAR